VRKRVDSGIAPARFLSEIELGTLLTDFFVYKKYAVVLLHHFCIVIDRVVGEIPRNFVIYCILFRMVTKFRSRKKPILYLLHRRSKYSTDLHIFGGWKRIWIYSINHQ
jgi:hypothetical protein